MACPTRLLTYWGGTHARRVLSVELGVLASSTVDLLLRSYCLSGRVAHQSCTALKDSSLVMSYIRMKPMAPR